MTQEEVTNLILKVAKRLSNKFTFPNVDEDDIEQEAFIIGMDALERYDGVRPLENFLSVHIKNRLKNYKRDHYYRQDQGRAEEIQKNKKKLLDAAPIDNFSFLLSKQFTDSYLYREVITYIDQRLPSHYRADYLRFQNDQALTKTKKSNLLKCLRGILEEFYAKGKV